MKTRQPIVGSLLTGAVLCGAVAVLAVLGGAPLWFALVCCLLIAGGTLALARATRRVRSELDAEKEAHLQSEARLAAIFEHAQIGLFQDTMLGGVSLKTDASLAGLFGYSTAAADSEFDLTRAFVDPADRIKMYEELERTGKVTRMEARFRRKGGSEFWARISSKHLKDRGFVVGIASDITEEVQAKEALVASESRYRTIFETTGTCTIIFDEDDVITLANEEWAKLSGTPREAIEGKLRWMQSFDPPSVDAVRACLARRTAGAEIVPNSVEVRLLDRAGGVHYGVITVRPVPGTSQCVGSFLDLTALKRAREQMFRVEKMAALGKIVAGVAHEINNPNNFITFNLPILKDYIGAMVPMMERGIDPGDEPEILNMRFDDFIADLHKLLENMEHGSKRITEIVADLKTYVGGRDEKEKKIEPIAPIVERVSTLARKQVSRTVASFEVNVEPDLPLVEMNVGRIEQVLINLLINAGQAADKKDSRVALNVGSWEDDRGRPWVEVRVEDNGTGIEPSVLDKIFDPFFTTKNAGEGTGLGLGISQQIAIDHGGSLSVTSVVGEGSCFTLRLAAQPPGR